MDSVKELLRQLAASFGLKPEVYDQWVAGHEAAHAVVTLHVGAELKTIELSAIASGVLSRARTIQTAGSAAVGKLIVIGAAGPAYDASVKTSLNLPDALVESVLRNDRESARTLVNNMIILDAKITEDQFIVHFWKNAKDEADNLIKDPALAEKILILSAHILREMQAGKKEITANEVVALLGK